MTRALKAVQAAVPHRVPNVQRRVNAMLLADSLTGDQNGRST